MRVERAVAVALQLAIAVAVLIASDACTPRVGDSCSGADVRCDDDRAGALACRAGKWTRVVCGGQNRCRPGASAVCDQTSAKEGDACIDGRACAADAVRMLRCDGGVFELAEKCAGPLGCVVASGAVSCDASRGNAGDPCREDGAITCDAEARAIVACEHGHFVARSSCRGPKGCALDESARPRCDDTIAAAGDPCATPDQVACSADGLAQLRCTGARFATVRICRRPPCTVSGDDLRCD